MLIYNSQKEFIGIDEKDLKTLGFNNLASLKTEVTDFADLFVKTPGYIHNFKHVHWIDFITCADSSEDSQVIINANNKNFKSKVTIENIFLADNTSSKAYIVYLSNLRELTTRESDVIAGDISIRPVKPAFVTPEVTNASYEDMQSSEEFVAVQDDPYETHLEIDFENEDDTVNEKLQLESELEVIEDNCLAIDAPDELLDVSDLSFEEDCIDMQLDSELEKELANESFDNGYVYDPCVASDELGLPLDLIGEFVQDFIAQAKEFKHDIYTALNEAEFEQVKIISHKLKGVAANLRIEDAFEVLSVVNTASHSAIIKENLDNFYHIIAKLAGEEIVVEKPASTPVVTQSNNDALIEMKDEEFEDSQDDDDDLYGDLLDVEDLEVSQQIDIPDLKNDDFASEALEMKAIENEVKNTKNISFLELDKELDIEIDEDIKLEMEDDLEYAQDIEIEEATPTIEVVPIEYSKESVANEIGLDSESFNELFNDYISDSTYIVSQMKEAHHENDFKACKHEAMKLQGMSDNMRINSFSKDFQTITHSTNKDEITEAIQNIETGILQISRVGA